MGQNTKSVTDQSFQADVLGSDKPVLVDFWAEWCGPCRMIAPALEEIAADLGDKVTIAKINIDENPDTPGKYGVRGIPTMLLFKNGEAVREGAVAVPKPEDQAGQHDQGQAISSEDKTEMRRCKIHGRSVTPRRRGRAPSGAGGAP